MAGGKVGSCLVNPLNFRLSEIFFIVGKLSWNFHPYIKQDAMLSQGEPRDVAISFDTTASCMRLLWYSMGFL